MAIASGKPKGKVERAGFRVDTKLLRELGELLVGRDATALLELVKNSYDADATSVTVEGRKLGSERSGSITVTDDGNGMTLAQFRSGFLQLAGRTKTAGDRHSARFGRRYTGEKGVGRLAAHKLARVMEVDSVPYSSGEARRRGVRARIDWNRVERRRDLAKAGEEIELESYRPRRGQPTGTEIRLRRLRHAWTPSDLAEFTASAEAFSPPRALVDSAALRVRLSPSKLLFRTPVVRQQRGDDPDPGFRIDFAGDFSVSTEHWDELTESVEWVLEIDATPKGVRYCVSPTQRELRKTESLARRAFFKVAHPDPEKGPFFQARVFARDRGGRKSFREWSAGVAGIRVYSEGFRVLPYGAPDNDWLEINRDYAARRRRLRLVDEDKTLAAEVKWDEDDDSALSILPSDSYVGAVFLTRERSGDLQALVNREGFVPNAAFDHLCRLTRLGVDLLTRARAAGRTEQRENAAAEREAVDKNPDEEGAGPTAAESWRQEVAASVEQTQTEISRLRESLETGDRAASQRELTNLGEEVSRLATAVNALIAEQRLIPVLASVGIQMGEFVHEINGLLAMASTIDLLLDRVREDPGNFASAQARRDVAEVHQSSRDLRARLERQATYLIDLTSPGAVRRRSRQRLSRRLDEVVELLHPVLEREEIRFANRVSPDLRTPPMFPAEVTAVLLNLLTNAIKAAGQGGRIRAAAKEVGEHDQLLLRIENTGEAVDLTDAERWFRPFETTTTEVDPLLGQGMGFGLPISRGILEEYGAGLDFVAPRKGYATAIEVSFP